MENFVNLVFCIFLYLVVSRKKMVKGKLYLNFPYLDEIVFCQIFLENNSISYEAK